MASRHFSLEMSEVGDVLDLLYHYEELNTVRLDVELKVQRFPRGPELVVAVAVWEAGVKPTDLPLLASVSVRCLATNLKGIRGAVTHALYLADSKLALLELERAESQRA